MLQPENELQQFRYKIITYICYLLSFAFVYWYRQVSTTSSNIKSLLNNSSCRMKMSCKDSDIILSSEEVIGFCFVLFLFFFLLHIDIKYQLQVTIWMHFVDWSKWTKQKYSYYIEVPSFHDNDTILKNDIFCLNYNW